MTWKQNYKLELQKKYLLGIDVFVDSTSRMENRIFKKSMANKTYAKEWQLKILIAFWSESLWGYYRCWITTIFGKQSVLMIYWRWWDYIFTNCKEDRYPNPNYSLPSRDEVLNFTEKILDKVCHIVEINKKEIIGFDINQKRIDDLNNGIDFTLELPAFNNNLKILPLVIVTVPTPIDKNKRPDLTPLIKASEIVIRCYWRRLCTYFGKVLKSNF